MATYMLRHPDYPTLFLERRSRRESGRFAWRGWLIDLWTPDPAQAMTWRTEEGAAGFARRYEALGMIVTEVE